MAAPRCIGIDETAAQGTLPSDYLPVPYGGHCGVLACAIIAGTDFKTAWDFLEPISPHKSGKPWTGLTNRLGREKFLAARGVRVKERTAVRAADMRWLREYKSPSLGDYMPRMQLRTFVSGYGKHHAKPDKTYMVTVKGHVVIVRGGFIYDQSQVACPASHWAATKLVMHVAELVE